jgi:DNA-directed RNA polymerase subunit N (RpoN/RPB10)
MIFISLSKMILNTIFLKYIKMDKSIKFYSLCNNTCSCRDENGDLTKIASVFRNYYNELKKNKNSAEILMKMGIMRTCCMCKFQLLATEPMIDRSTDRIINEIKKPFIKMNTRVLEPKFPPPEFPSLF